MIEEDCKWELKESVIKRKDILQKLEDGNRRPCAVPEIRRRSEGMGWVSPFLSSIFLPREQNENMKSLEMSDT